MNKKLIVIFSIFSFFYFIVICRLYYFQVKNSNQICSEFAGIGKKKPTRSAIRGTIYDINGVPLALSIMKFNLIINSKIASAKDKKNISGKLAKIINMKAKDIYKKINNKNSYNLLIKNIDITTKEKINKEIVQKKKKIIYFEETGERIYPEGEMAMHILGKCNAENNGVFGLENIFNDYLSGYSSDTKITCDATGEQLIKESGRLKDISDLFITLDKNVQFFCEDISKKAIVKYKASNVEILVQNVKSGDILGWSQILKDKSKYFVNVGLTNSFEPGSTFKIFVAAQILEQKKADFDTPVFCENGKMKVFDITIKDHEKYDMLLFKDVFAKSSNIGMAKTGIKISKEDFYKNILNFGFGSKTGIILSAEAKGYIPRPNTKPWSGVTQYTMTYGQGLTCNALQMITAVSAIANNGALLRPQIINKIIDFNKKEVYKSDKTVIRQVVSPEIAKKVSELMFYTVHSDEGTGKNARIENIKVAGKTGTAQKTITGKKGYAKGRYIANFAGFFPYEDPVICIYVIVDEPIDRYYAGEVAAPIFSELGTKIVDYMQIKKDIEYSYAIESRPF